MGYLHEKISIILASVTIFFVVAGCSTSNSTPAPTNGADTSAPSTDVAAQKAAYGGAIIAETRIKDLFVATPGLEADKKVTYLVATGSKEEAVSFLSTISWDQALAAKEYDAVLADAAGLAKANQALEAQAKKDGKKGFVPVTAVASDKLGKNTLLDSKFEDVKVTQKDGKYVITYKSLTYTVEKTSNGYKVVTKEGTLQ